MRILKKKIIYQNEPYIAIINDGISIEGDDITSYYEVKIKKPHHIRSEYSTIFYIDSSYMEMILEAMKEYIEEKEYIDKELSEIDKIKEWDGVINEL